MCVKKLITHNEQISPYVTKQKRQNAIFWFQAWNQPFNFSKLVLRHMIHFVDRLSSTGFSGKLTEIRKLCHQPKPTSNRWHRILVI